MKCRYSYLLEEYSTSIQKTALNTVGYNNITSRLLLRRDPARIRPGS